jgi:hypothetical protein
VLRVEHRLLVEHEGRTLYGLLGSFAVGATEVGSPARVVEARIYRIVCVGGGLLVERFEAPLVDNRSRVAFDPETVPENKPESPGLGLLGAMRREEALLAEELANRGATVFLDGPVSFVAKVALRIAGFVKRQRRSYLPPAEAVLLGQLKVGERTPLFLIGDARHPRYSWYVRIGAGRSIDHALAGVVRLETATSDLLGVQRLADASAAELPRFASEPGHDPRAPQNLYPIGGLETRLRHLLGDPLVVRRAVEARLFAEAAQAALA